MSEETPEPTSISINEVLGRALSEMQIPCGPAPVGYGWQVVKAPDADGKDQLFAVLSLSDGNGVHLYWFPVEGMVAFANHTGMTAQHAVMQNQMLNPLLVATPQQAQQIVNPSSNGFGSKSDINWPPADWKQ